MVPVARPASAGEIRQRERRIPGLNSVPIVDVSSSDEDDDEEAENVESDDEEEGGGSGFDSSGGALGRDDGAGDDDDGQEGETVDRRRGVLEEFGPDGGGLGGGFDRGSEVVSHPASSGSRFKRHRVHILQGGEDVAMEDDDPERGASNHAFGDASRSGLVHYAVECGTDEPVTDLYTSPDLRGCNLIGNEEEHQFLGGTFRRISIPKEEFFLSKQLMDYLTWDVEVAGIKALLLARGARPRHGHVETELQEKLAASKKTGVDLEAANKELSKQIALLQAKIKRDK